MFITRKHYQSLLNIKRRVMAMERCEAGERVLKNPQEYSKEKVKKCMDCLHIAFYGKEKRQMTNEEAISFFEGRAGK